MKNLSTLLFSFLFISIAICQDYKQGSKVDISWNNSWYKGTVLEVKDGKYKVHYEGWSSSWDEWVPANRLRTANENKSSTSTSTSTTTTTSTSTSGLETIKTGTTPKAGKWQAVISNGYKGDVLTFTVSSDSKRVENVEFNGHWQNKRRTIEVLRNLDPPEPFVITKGSFSAVQQVPKSAMWWEVTGIFLTATTAEGTYRAAFAGGENDTYKLKWTAKKVL